MSHIRVSLVCLSMLGALACCRPATADFSFVHGGHSYLVVEQNLTWQAAAVDAATRQVGGSPGYLTVVEDAAENSAIFNQLVANIPPAEFDLTRAPDGGNGVYVWIGANDLDIEGRWTWGRGGCRDLCSAFYQGQGNAGGGPVDGRYHNWGTFNGAAWEPDNGAGGLQDAGVMALADYPRGLASQWNDVRADNLLYYVVEFNAVPEPATLTLLIVGTIWFACLGHHPKCCRN